MKAKTASGDPPLVPAALFLLATGRYAPPGIPGWVWLERSMETYAHDCQVWRDSVMTPEILRWLEAEGGAYQFRPWGLTGRGPRPRGMAVDAWTRQFLEQHRRPDDVPPSRTEP